MQQIGGKKAYYLGSLGELPALHTLSKMHTQKTQ